LAHELGVSQLVHADSLVGSSSGDKKVVLGNGYRLNGPFRAGKDAFLGTTTQVPKRH
jgi:hypothetical protein